MTGQAGRSGRRPKPGKGYQFYFRFDPIRDPAELQDILEQIMAVKGKERHDLLRDALLGFIRSSNLVEGDDSIEIPEVTSMIDDLFA